MKSEYCYLLKIKIEPFSYESWNVYNLAYLDIKAKKWLTLQEWDSNFSSTTTTYSIRTGHNSGFFTRMTQCWPLKASSSWDWMLLEASMVPYHRSSTTSRHLTISLQWAMALSHLSQVRFQSMKDSLSSFLRRSIYSPVVSKVTTCTTMFSEWTTGEWVN